MPPCRLRVSTVAERAQRGAGAARIVGAADADSAPSRCPAALRDSYPRRTVSHRPRRRRLRRVARPGTATSLPLPGAVTNRCPQAATQLADGRLAQHPPTACHDLTSVEYEQVLWSTPRPANGRGLN